MADPNKQYMVIVDGGDGDFSWELKDTQEEADAFLDGTEDDEDAWDHRREGFFGVLEIDWEARTFTRTVHCQ